VSCSEDGWIIFWNMLGEIYNKFEDLNIINCIDWNYNGSELVTGNGNGKI
jgi:hypothetical protein